MFNKRAAIIILTYNGSEYIGDLFSSLAKINYPRDYYEVVIVDNASTDDTQEIIKKLTTYNLKLTTIFNETNTGFAAGNNIGLQYAIDHNFDYVFLLNQDTVVDPDFLTEAIKTAASDEKIAAVQSRLMLYNNKEIINSIGNQIHYLGFGYAGGNGRPATSYKLPATSSEITYPSGAAMLIKVDHLKKIGLLNSDFFMYHEDLDWGWRAWLLGYKVELAWNSIVYHKYEFSRSIKKYYYMERNRQIVVLQNYKLGTILLIMPVYLFLGIAMFFYSWLAGWSKEEVSVARYFLNINNWKKILTRRKLIQKQRQVPDSFILNKFAGTIEYQESPNPILKYFLNPFLNVCFVLIKQIIWW